MKEKYKSKTKTKKTMEERIPVKNINHFHWWRRDVGYKNIEFPFSEKMKKEHIL